MRIYYQGQREVVDRMTDLPFPLRQTGVLRGDGRGYRILILEGLGSLAPNSCGRSAVYVIARDRVHRAVCNVRLRLERIVTISIGVASATAVGDDATGRTMIERADEALYDAKRAGRDRVGVGTESSRSCNLRDAAARVHAALARAGARG